MRIILIPSSYLPVIGGLQTVVAQLAEGFAARGVAVMVVTNKYPRRLPDREIISGVPVRRFNFILLRWRDLTRGRVDLFLAGLWYMPVATVQLLVTLWQFKPDAVNLHFVGAPGLFVLLAHWLLGFRLVVSLHGDDVQGLARRGKFDRWVFRQLVSRAAAVTACSNFLLHEVEGYTAIPAERVRVIYNALDVNKVPIVGTFGANWVAVGRLVPKKGFDVLLRALALTGHPAPHLTLVGEGPERSALQVLSRDLRLDSHVTFCGALPHDETLAVLAASRAVVIPSREEPFGMVALEAMAAGKPIVATHAGGLPEVLEGTDSVLVKPEDVSGLAKALMQVEEILKVNPLFGVRNRALAARFAPARMLEAYLELLI